MVGKSGCHYGAVVQYGSVRSLKEGNVFTRLSVCLSFYSGSPCDNHMGLPWLPPHRDPSDLFKLGTVRKRSLLQGNIFKGVCLSTGISLTETPLDRDPPLERPPGQKHLPPTGQRPPRTVKSGRYASYWNVFLFTWPFTESPSCCIL